MRRNDNWQWHDYICGSLKYHYNYICEFREYFVVVVDLIF